MLAHSAIFTTLRSSAVISGFKLLQPFRSFSTTPSQRLKEIVVTQSDKVTVIEGQLKPAPWENRLLKTEAGKPCALCATNLDVKHTDVLILSQYVRLDGCMLPRRITGLCKTQQKRVSKMVAMAQKAGLMSNLTPETSKKDPKRRKKWKKFNMYWDERTITPPREYRKRDPQLYQLV